MTALKALIADLGRGDMRELDRYRTTQHHKPAGSAVLLEWELMGVTITYTASWPKDFPPTGPIEVRGQLRETIIRDVIDIIDREIKAAIAAKEAP
jgi:hypothetical protein